jgi:hypothetical protein
MSAKVILQEIFSADCFRQHLTFSYLTPALGCDATRRVKASGDCSSRYHSVPVGITLYQFVQVVDREETASRYAR